MNGYQAPRALLGVVLLLLVIPHISSAQSFEFFPGAKYDPAIPTLKQAVGHDWGE